MSAFEHIFSPGGMYEFCSKFAMFLMLTWNKYHMFFQFFYNSAFWDLSNVDIFKHLLNCMTQCFEKIQFFIVGSFHNMRNEMFLTYSVKTYLSNFTCQTLLVKLN